MKSKVLLPAVLAAVLVTAGCHKQEQPAADAVREGIQQHLNSLTTLNLSAMNINISNISINQNTAQAQAEFTPKTGGPPGAGMRVSYSLEKHDDKWVVVKTNPLGGAINHPDPSANPHGQAPPGTVHGNLPNFRDMIPSNTTDPNAPLPPGHPSVPPSEKPAQP
jgi:hypothetical protein